MSQAKNVMVPDPMAPKVKAQSGRVLDVKWFGLVETSLLGRKTGTVPGAWPISFQASKAYQRLARKPGV